MMDISVVRQVFVEKGRFLSEFTHNTQNCHFFLDDRCVFDGRGDMGKYLQFFYHECIDKYRIEGEEPLYESLYYCYEPIQNEETGETERCQQTYCTLLTTTSLYIVRTNKFARIEDNTQEFFGVDWVNVSGAKATRDGLLIGYQQDGKENSFQFEWEWLVSYSKIKKEKDWERLFSEIVNINSENNNHDLMMSTNNNKHIEYLIGIDLGHGETSAAICPVQWDITDVKIIEPVKDLEMGGNKKVIPSAITILNNGNAYIGDAAFAPEILKQAHVHVCFKAAPKDINGEKERLMIRFMKEVYNRIRQNNSAMLIDGNHLVYIATPSGWDKETQALYVEMAKQAGLPMGGVTKESRAAFVRAQNDVTSGLGRNIEKGAIVFDMGSSTLDFTYMKKGHLIDYGYDCGASFIEKAIYADKEQEDESIQLFEKKYPDLVDYLVFEARKVKEQVYYDSTLRVKKTINFDDFIEDDDLEDERFKLAFLPGELNALLMQKGYLQQIRDAMLDFRENHIPGEKIYGVFMTGGASRMDFLKDLICECWDVEPSQIFRDQDPSLTISEGVAEVARMDLRTEGMDVGLEEAINRLIDGTLIYHDFVEAFSQALFDEATGDIANTVISFKDAVENYSINDLSSAISENVKSGISEISKQANQYVEAAIDKNTQEIRAKVENIIAHYSSEGVQVTIPTITVPAIKVSGISIKPVLDEIVDGIASESGISFGGMAGGAAAGAAIGSFIPIIGTITGALIGGAIGAFSQDEEDKKRKARETDLDQSKRLQVYNYLENKWDQIQNDVRDAVDKSVKSNKIIKDTIRNVTSDLLTAYKENLKSARVLID